ncbi:MAG: 5-formyltetrahydrofolate cyclo-ligase [Alphaproteobacteria bacterium]|nr:5-formyltetrahydrofolate cyclo-ligase [Alphaproteobacteria bacterium]
MSPAKATLRREARARRAALAASHPRAGEALAALAPGLLALLTARGLPPDIAGYVPIRDEIDVLPLLAALAAGRARLSLPATEGRDAPLLFRRWSPGGALLPGPHGTREPAPEAPRAAPCLLLVPCLAFDAAGTRLGYGGGLYDRTLAALAGRDVLALGCAFSGQEVARLPREAHDRPLDGMLTESGFRAGAATGLAPYFGKDL